MCNAYNEPPSLQDLADALGGLSEQLSTAVAELLGHGVYPKRQAIIVANDRREWQSAHWGFISGWSVPGPKNPKGLMPNNARDDKMMKPGVWNKAIKSQRCLLPVSHFFEYGKFEPYLKKKVRIGMADDQPFMVAGLWNRMNWSGTEGLLSCTMITTTPNDVIAAYHDRMPAILPASAWKEWLTPGEREPGAMLELIKPYPADRMKIEDAPKKEA